MSTTVTSLSGRRRSRLGRILQSRKKGSELPDGPTETTTNDVNGQDVPQIHTKGQTASTSEDQSLAPNRGTSDVGNEDSDDDVVVKTTTQTVTTTTTETKGGRKGKVNVRTTSDDGRPSQHSSENHPAPHQSETTPAPPVSSNQVSNDSVHLAPNEGQPAELPTTRSRTSSPTPDTSSSRTFLTPATAEEPAPRVSDTSHSPVTTPDIPPRSTHRPSEPQPTTSHEPVSPIVPYSPDFTYPIQSHDATDPTQSAINNTTSTPSSSSNGTLANLKAAAIGLHGVGETLRGTLNDTVDRHLPRGHHPEYAQDKNTAVLERGREEMGRLGVNPLTTPTTTTTTAAVGEPQASSTAEQVQALEMLRKQGVISPGTEARKRAVLTKARPPRKRSYGGAPGEGGTGGVAGGTNQKPNKRGLRAFWPSSSSS